jgi:hypothetical protein
LLILLYFLWSHIPHSEAVVAGIGNCHVNNVIFFFLGVFSAGSVLFRAVASDDEVAWPRPSLTGYAVLLVGPLRPGGPCNML